ncbi:hypothetical protein P4C99_20990 [Pontiellaceae bacterium B1224]|nr:hypothetical protein [Pontiellaceae bacterium B1224]
MKRIIVISILWFAVFSCIAAGLDRQTWLVEGVTRQALVYSPADIPTNGCPLIFVFHGHGGNMRNGARQFRMHELWPEAMVVYMQGLPTRGQLTDPEGKKNGWNCNPNDLENRDLHFFDAVYASLLEKADPDRVFSTGHSNGGSFTYCLWAVRGERLAAVAPSGAALGRCRGKVTPKPALHLAGENDPLVKYEWQARTIQALRKQNDCEQTGEPWASSGTLTGTLFPSDTNTPVITLIHPAGHTFPAEAPELIVRFFKEQSR